MELEANKKYFYEIHQGSHDIRLDVFLASCPVNLTRSRIQTLIKDGHVKVNTRSAKPGHRLCPGDQVSLFVPPSSPLPLEPEEMGFDIIHEDDSIVVLNKPAGLVVHPAPGHATGTLVHGLLEHCKALSGIGGKLRPGIVHRLDRDTSGIMVVAKNDLTHTFLTKQFKSGLVKKKYVALVHGQMEGDRGRIDLPIARHPKKRKQMSVILSGGRGALTLWQKLEEFESGFSLLSITLKTGRTHQIRVHLSYIGHPVAGDPVYGYGRNWWKKHPLNKKGLFPKITRQMLHAVCLGFIHPEKDLFVKFETPLPDDMAQAIQALKQCNHHPNSNTSLLTPMILNGMELG